LTNEFADKNGRDHADDKVEVILNATDFMPIHARRTNAAATNVMMDHGLHLGRQQRRIVFHMPIAVEVDLGVVVFGLRCGRRLFGSSRTSRSPVNRAPELIVLVISPAVNDGPTPRSAATPVNRDEYQFLRLTSNYTTCAPRAGGADGSPCANERCNQWGIRPAGTKSSAQ
jgi:hypothetical protein